MLKGVMLKGVMKGVMLKRFPQRGIPILLLLSIAGCASTAPLNALDHVPAAAWQEPFGSERATISLSDEQTSPPTSP